MKIDELARKAAEEIKHRYGIGATEPSEIIARTFAPLAEQNRNLMALLQHLERIGGLGLDTHERIRKALAECE